MLCLAFFIAVLTVVNSEIHSHVNQNNQKIRCILRYLLQNLHNIHQRYKPTLLVFASEQDALLSNNDNFVFSDAVIEEAVTNQAPYIITDNISGLNITDDNTLFSIVYIENCDHLNEIAKGINKQIKYFIIINEICEVVLSDILHVYEFYDVRFITVDPDTQQFVFLTINSEMNENNCRLVKHITKKKIVTNEICTFPKNATRKLLSPTTSFNMKKCTLNVGMASLYPYAIIRNKEQLSNYDPLDNVHGADVELIKIILDHFNATLSLHYIYREEETPYLHSEFLDLVLNGSLDACAGGLYRIYGNVVTYSGIYSQQSVVWVYTIERSARSFDALISKISGLYIFFIFYLVYTIAWNIVCKFDQKTVSFQDTLLYSWGALTAASSLQIAKTLKQRFLNILYLFMCIMLTSYINCQMYSYLTVLDPPQHFRTAAELKMSNRQPYLVKYFIKNHKYKPFSNTSISCNDFKECETLMLENNGFTVLIDGQLPLLQATTAVNGDARVLKLPEEVLTIFHEMFIRKDSPLAKDFKKVTHRLFEAGICEKLYEEAIGLLVLQKANFAVKSILSNSYSCSVGCRISMSQISYVFFIWIIGCVISCAVFVVEIFLNRK